MCKKLCLDLYPSQHAKIFIKSSDHYLKLFKKIIPLSESECVHLSRRKLVRHSVNIRLLAACCQRLTEVDLDVMPVFAPNTDPNS